LDRKARLALFRFMATGTSVTERVRANPVAAAAIVIALVAAATLAGAWFFQLVLGLDPCPLCLDQRIPYYVAVPLGIVIGIAARNADMKQVARLGLFVLGAVLLVGAGYGVYHSGVEWGFWEGPASCAGGSPSGPVGNVLSSLKATTRVVPCTEAAWRFLGLSLAGYNVLIAGALAALAFWTAFARAGRAAR
jgi:disulfide bond formation protein DsbB